MKRTKKIFNFKTHLVYIWYKVEAGEDVTMSLNGNQSVGAHNEIHL